MSKTIEPIKNCHYNKVNDLSKLLGAVKGKKYKNSNLFLVSKNDIVTFS